MIEFSVVDWSAWAPGLTTKSDWQAWAQAPALPEGDDTPGLPEVPAMQRRRIERLGRMAIQAACWCEQPDDAGQVPLVFASRHGLLRRSLALVPHAKVQSVRLAQGPWQRLWRLAAVHVDTGANKTVTARLRDVEEAAELLRAQAERSRTGRRDARPDRWMA